MCRVTTDDDRDYSDYYYHYYAYNDYDNDRRIQHGRRELQVPPQSMDTACKITFEFLLSRKHVYGGWVYSTSTRRLGVSIKSG